MGFGAALNNTEISLLAAGMGWWDQVYIPDEYWLHISMTPVADNGDGITYPNFTTDPVNTPYDPDTYWPQKMPDWAEVKDDADPNAPDPVTASWTRIWSTPTDAVVFPTPSVDWWPDQTWIYPFLADSWDPSVLVPLWTWRVLCGRVDKDHLLVFDKMTNPYAHATGGDIRIGFSLEQGSKGSGWTRRDWYYGALGTVLQPVNFGGYSPPTSWWLAMTNANHLEPSDSSYPAGGDPNYVRKQLQNFSVPDHNIGNGMASFWNQDYYEWKIGAPTEPNPANPAAWDTNMTAEVYDSAAPGSGNRWFAFGGQNDRGLHNRYFYVSSGGLVWDCD